MVELAEDRKAFAIYEVISSHKVQAISSSMTRIIVKVFKMCCLVFCTPVDILLQVALLYDNPLILIVVVYIMNTGMYTEGDLGKDWWRL